MLQGLQGHLFPLPTKLQSSDSILSDQISKHIFINYEPKYLEVAGIHN